MPNSVEEGKISGAAAAAAAVVAEEDRSSSSSSSNRLAEAEFSSVLGVGGSEEDPAEGQQQQRDNGGGSEMQRTTASVSTAAAPKATVVSEEEEEEEEGNTANGSSPPPPESSSAAADDSAATGVSSRELISSIGGGSREGACAAEGSAGSAEKGGREVPAGTEEEQQQCQFPAGADEDETAAAAAAATGPGHHRDNNATSATPAQDGDEGELLQNSNNNSSVEQQEEEGTGAAAAVAVEASPVIDASNSSNGNNEGQREEEEDAGAADPGSSPAPELEEENTGEEKGEAEEAAPSPSEGAEDSGNAASIESEGEEEEKGSPELAVDNNNGIGEDSSKSTPEAASECEDGKEEEAAVAAAIAAATSPAASVSTAVSPASSASLGTTLSSGSQQRSVAGSSAETSAAADAATVDGVSTIVELPMDSLHSVASFLTPCEWSEFGRAGRSARRVCREIIRRVRMHGFRCASEVVTAWKLGQHADARELAALYVREGVPVYPTSLGHSYHTLLWRMGVEIKEMEERQGSGQQQTQQQQDEGQRGVMTASVGGAAPAAAAGAAAGNGPGNESSSGSGRSGSAAAASSPSSSGATAAASIDPFFRERLEFRSRENYGDQLSYVAEKSLFWMDKNAAAAAAAAASGSDGGSRRSSFRPPSNRSASPVAELLASAATAAGSGNHSRASSIASPHFGGGCTSPKKMPIKVHQHLLHQHNLGRFFVNDGDGTMVTPPVSLSVDFFHPNSRQFASSSSKRNGAGGAPPPPASSPTVSAARSADIVLPEVGEGGAGEAAAAAAAAVPPPVPVFRLADERLLLPEGGVADGAAAAPPPPPIAAAAGDEQEAGEVARAALPGFLEEQELDVDNHDTLFEPTTNPVPQAKLLALLSAVELEVYSSLFTGGAKKESGGDGAHELKRHLRSRYATYQRRLEAFLAHSDHSGFDECILDFWDEFFPHTSGIHYYDRHTPVPRISCLQKFLTKPCPKAIGIVQCEIQRLKITTRGKGVNVKGRLFPTYEYRLFIRNYPINADSLTEDDPPPTRRDTVLMVAKNRGRKHMQASGVVPASISSKKGSNNYYLYLPQQSDVDDHFNKVNETEKAVKMNPNGASIDPVIKSSSPSSALLGRLQSNFIGTEFQIFTPHMQKRPRRKPAMDGQCSAHYSPSEDELDYDSGVSSDNTASRRSRFGRLSLRRNSHHLVDASSEPIGRSLNMSRAASSPDLPQGRHTRTSRRAIAANTSSDSQELQQRQSQVPPDPGFYEAEDGAITYTANLLGSRPRIMDVCIPKVTTDGVAGIDWKRYLEACDDTDECGMINCFRQLQQRLADEQSAAAGDDFAGNRDSESEAGDNDEDGATDFGLMALQNRPPWWNIELGSFVLNFGGRVSVASVKNFQLCDRNDHDRIMLQFGRIQGRHSFTMDFQHPLTAVQAFSIAISSLQSKISFG